MAVMELICECGTQEGRGMKFFRAGADQRHPIRINRRMDGMGEKSQSKRWKGPAPCPAAQLSVKEADQRPPYGKLRCRGKGDRRKVRQKAIHSTKNALVPGTLVLACLPMIPCGPHGDILPVMSPHLPFIGLCLLPLRQRSFP